MFKEEIQTPKMERSASSGVEHFEVAGNPGNELIDTLGEYVPSVNAIRHPEIARGLVREVAIATHELSQEIGSEENKSASVIVKLVPKVEELKNRIRKLFAQPDPHGGYTSVPRERESWSITKEFLQAIKTFNGEIKKAEQVAGVSLGEYKEYYFGQIKEAEEISSGRLLTHGAPTNVMYQILERGDICSITEQEKRHSMATRTHELAPVTIRPTETHDICFEVDRVYGNFVSSVGQFKTDVILILSENHILNRRQYVDLDGRHVFDERYVGDTEESPGLRIDLLQTPFRILVSEAEKNRLIDFLVNKSAFKDVLKQLEPEGQRNWLEEHVIATPKIGDFKISDESKKRFFQISKLQPKKGYVELTDTSAGFKVGQRKTKQFLPLVA